MSVSSHANLWQVAAENVWRHAGKSVAVWVPLTIAVAVFAALSFMRDGMVKDALLAAEVMPDLTVQSLIGGRPERLPLALEEGVARLANVERVARRVWGYVPIKIGGWSFAYTLMGLDARSMPRPESIGMAIESGRYLNEGDTDAAVLGKAVAEGLHVEVGDTLSLADELGNAGRFKVVGLFASEVQIHAADLIVVPLQAARNFFGYRDGEVTDLCVYLNEPSTAGPVAADIQALAKGTRVLSKEAVRNAVLQVYGSRAGVFQAMWLILLLTVMLAAWAEANGANTRLNREIGILKATGWSTTNIIEMKVFENAMIATAATLGGMVLGLGYLLAGAPGIKAYFLGWAVIYPDMEIPVHVTGATAGLIAAIGIFPFLVATIIPAWAAGIIDPDEAMRG
jgi:ABC-type lipoprotein release transport system permease subunit